MAEVVAIVEGRTEQTFVRHQLAEHLGYRGITIWPVLPGKARRQGGVRRWPSARNDILRTLKEGRFCTTMFDYYAMPNDWPGRAESISLPWNERGERVEKELLIDITSDLGESFDPSQFIPYVQVHEFEAILFSRTRELAEVSSAVSKTEPNQLESDFDEIVDAAGFPEAIDDGYATCPLRRIVKIVPGFQKALHGPIVANRIGVAIIKEKCPHFGSWIDRLEQLGSAP